MSVDECLGEGFERMFSSRRVVHEFGCCLVACNLLSVCTEAMLLVMSYIVAVIMQTSVLHSIWLL